MDSDHDHHNTSGSERRGTKRKAAAIEVVELSSDDGDAVVLSSVDDVGDDDREVELVAETARARKRPARAAHAAAETQTALAPLRAATAPAAPIPPDARVSDADAAVIQFLEQTLDLSSLADDLYADPTFPLPKDWRCIHNHIVEYRRFLVLKVVHRDADAQLLSPSPIVDHIWHAHILDTKAYAAMCAKLPFFIHHNPKGARKTDDQSRARRRENTRACYYARYGMPIFVKGLRGQTDTLYVRSTDSLNRVHELYQEKAGCVEGGYRLIFAGKQLQGEVSVVDAGISKERVMGVVSKTQMIG
ncbi:hypothetical protein GGF32_004328 [Allomyces javanicus]|nr:hypothetical protein GGF32_004328 [Allomyces javanicus]